MRLAQGQTGDEICRQIGISEQSYYRWRRECGGLKLDQAQRLKDLKRENGRLRQAVADLTVEKLVPRSLLRETGKLRAALALCDPRPTEV